MNTNCSRRWYQFNLTGLLVSVTLLAIGLGLANALIPVVRFLQNPLDFGGHDEFERLSGSAARRRMDWAWPKGVDSRDVEIVSHKYEATRDSLSSWTRIRLTPAAAQAWADDVHAYQERDARVSQNQLEGVRYTFIGSPPLHRQTGSTPDWWLPPGAEVRATEIMLWYEGGSGVGRATYTSFHPETKTLWVYGYCSQHHKLWSQGSPPRGVPIR